MHTKKLTLGEQLGPDTELSRTYQQIQRDFVPATVGRQPGVPATLGERSWGRKSLTEPSGVAGNSPTPAGVLEVG